MLQIEHRSHERSVEASVIVVAKREEEFNALGGNYPRFSRVSAALQPMDRSVYAPTRRPRPVPRTHRRQADVAGKAWQLAVAQAWFTNNVVVMVTIRGDLQEALKEVLLESMDPSPLGVGIAE
jgi:hypothetical protein